MDSLFYTVQHHSGEAWNSAIAFTVLCTVAVALRLGTKMATSAGLGWDDSFLIIGLLLWYGQTASELHGEYLRLDARKKQ